MQHFLPRISGLQKAAACVHPQEIRVSFILARGRGSWIGSFQLFGLRARTLFSPSCLAGFYCSFLEKLSFFIGVLTLKHLETLKSPSEVIFIITKWSQLEAVKTCPSPVIDTKLNHILCH